MNWRHYPWLLAILLAPLLHGSVGLEGKSVVCLLFATSLLLLSGQLTRPNHSDPKPIWPWLALTCLVLPLVPLPVSLLEWLSPERVAMALEFPLEQGSTAAWISSTLSTSQTIQRLTELALILTAFQLARSASTLPGFPKQLVTTICLSLLLLAASDVWLRLSGQDRLLGIWPDSAGHGAGTFANRNHYANWIYVAALFASGWLLRQHWPLLSARLRPLAKPTPKTKRSFQGPLSWIAIPAALIMAVQCGSRAGLLVLVAGTTVWCAFLLHRSRDRQRWIALGGVATLLAIALLASANFLWIRFANASTDITFKTAIWKDASSLIGTFPLLGTGPGGFATAFNHFKSFGGEQSFLHVENEFLQLWIEQGLIGGTIISIVLFLLLRKAFLFAWRQPLPEPELTFGALAALAGYLSHCLLEFVFQIPANALLAAVLLGFVLGQRDTTIRTAVVPPPTRNRILLNLGWGTALLFLSLCLAISSIRWHQGRLAKSPADRTRHTEAALRFWPWETTRQLALTRLQVATLPSSANRSHPSAPPIRARLMRSLASDPYNWELRLERAWLDLTFHPDPLLGQAEAWEVARLNPLQPQIPLQFAQQFAHRNPALALDFIESASFRRQDHIRQALNLAWNINNNTDSLWALTPLTTEALTTLANFASEQHLLGMADQARQLALTPPPLPPDQIPSQTIHARTP